MTGFDLKIHVNDLPEGIRFRLYDNAVLAVDNIGVMDFRYLTPEDYEGVHTLSMTYFDEINPSEESSPKTIFTRDFTLPTLDYTVDVEII